MELQLDAAIHAGNENDLVSARRKQFATFGADPAYVGKVVVVLIANGLLPLGDETSGVVAESIEAEEPVN